MEMTSSYALPTRIIAWLMLVFMLTVVPLQWHVAYAQGLPGQKPTSQQIDQAVQSRSEDRATTDTLKNMRDSQLGKGWVDNTPVRTAPTTGAGDSTPLRSPSLIQPANNAAQAQRQAQQSVPALQVGDLVQNAQRGNDLGQTLLGGANTDNRTLTTQRLDPGQEQPNSTNIHSIVPGYTETEAQGLNAFGQRFYNDPTLLKSEAEINSRSLKRQGCRRTNLVRLEAQNIASAASSPSNRILKIEFFDLERRAIPGTNPIEYETIQTPSTYRRGTIKLNLPTLGGKPSQWWDKVDDTFAIRYTYTPYSAPKKENFFTYGHKLAISNGGSIQVLPDNYFTSYGTPSDAFTPSIGYTVPTGVSAVYLSADLYRADTYYSDPAGGACPPDPPATCSVQSYGGDVLSWCPGSPGNGVLMMYDDWNNPSNKAMGKRMLDAIQGNVSRHDYSGDAMLASGVVRGVNAPQSSSVQSLIGQCSRTTIGQITSSFNNNYHNEDIQTCHETLINPYPNGCNTLRRSFGLSRLGDHVFLTVRAYNKVAVPIINPSTGQQVKINGVPQYTYRKDVANVSGSIDTAFSILGASRCSGGGGSGCSTERLPDNPDGSSAGYFVEYSHTPMGGDPKQFVINGVSVSGGSGSFSHYGVPSANWTPTGSASGSGSSSELRLIADIYAVTINDLTGCPNYLKYAADSFCQGARLTCLDTASSRTVGGVTFGPGMATSGVLDVLKKWGTDASAEVPNYADGNSADPSPTGPALVLLNDQMCWEAKGEPFTTCQAMDTSSGSLREFTRNGEIWRTDCNITPAPTGGMLETSSCARASQYDTCDSRFQGVFSGVCYNPTIAYDCGDNTSSTVNLTTDEVADSCSGAMRCMGTQCHKPNLTGTQLADFSRAAAGMEALNMMKANMVCAETGEPATAVSGGPPCPNGGTLSGTSCVTTTSYSASYDDSGFATCPNGGSVSYSGYTSPTCVITSSYPATPGTCTPSVFGGKPLYCKIPIGSGIGLTPDCCKETKNAVASAGGPNWLEYLKATYLIYKIGQNSLVQGFLQQSSVYNSTAQMFGEIAQPVTDAYASASQFVTENFVDPLSAGFDNLFSSFGGGSSGAAGQAASAAVDSATKSGVIGQVIDQVKQKMLEVAQAFLKDTIGDAATNQIIKPSAQNGALVLTTGAQQVVDAISGVMMAYSIARIIGHIIYACRQEEYEWAMNMRWRLCTYVASCCSQKVFLLGCIESRKLHCCYKSIAARVISEQIIKQNLTGTRPFGYRTNPDGVRRLGKCSINCRGFTPVELAAVDWSRVDLSEWLDAMIESGIFHPNNPNTDFGVSQNSVPMTMTVGRTEPDPSMFDQRVPAVKTVEGLSQNVGQLLNNTNTLKAAPQHCYDDDRKMPFTYPGGCPTTGN